MTNFHIHDFGLEIPDVLEKIVDKCLQAEKEKRFNNAEEIILELRKIS